MAQLTDKTHVSVLQVAKQIALLLSIVQWVRLDWAVHTSPVISHQLSCGQTGSVTLPWYQPRPCPLLYLFEDLLMTIMRWCTLHSFFPISNHMHAYHVRCLSWLYLNICYEFDQKINLLCWEKVSVALINPVVPYSTVCNPDLREAEEMPE